MQVPGSVETCFNYKLSVTILVMSRAVWTVPVVRRANDLSFWTP